MIDDWLGLYLNHHNGAIRTNVAEVFTVNEFNMIPAFTLASTQTLYRTLTDLHAHSDIDTNTHLSWGLAGANLPLLLPRNTPASQNKVGSNPKGRRI